MKRGVFVKFLIVSVFLLLIFPFEAHAGNDTDFDLAKGFEWLNSEMQATNWGSDIDSLSWTILALKNGGYDVSPGLDKLEQLQSHSDHWGTGGGDVYETALATLAMYKSGRNVDAEIDWLEHEQEEVRSGGDWLIQFLVDTDDEVVCKIYYDDEPEKEFTINDTIIVAAEYGCGEGESWVNFEECIKSGSADKYEEFSVNCRSSSVETSLLYHSGQDYYIVDQSAPLEIENACFHGRSSSCRCGATQYASWVLEEVGIHPYTFPYLRSDCNDEIDDNVFLYMLTGNNIYSSFLEDEKSDSDGSWEGREETTALAIIALEESNVMISDSKEWLEFQQRKSDGSWDEDVKTTAMVLYALTDDVYISPTHNNTIDGTCGNSILDAGEECEFTSDCNGSTQICQGCYCLSQPDCEYDYECDDGKVCEGGFCIDDTGCSSNSECDNGYDCENGRCEWRGTEEYDGCSYDYDCQDDEICEDGVCVSEGGGWLTWLIVAIIIILAGVGGYFGYKQYFRKGIKPKGGVPGKALPMRKSPLSVYPTTNQKVPKRAGVPPVAKSSVGDRLERELDSSLKKAK